MKLNFKTRPPINESGVTLISVLIGVGIAVMGMMALMQFVSFEVTAAAINRNKQGFQDISTAFEANIGNAMTTFIQQTGCNSSNQSFGTSINNEALGPWGKLTLMTARPLPSSTWPAAERAASARCTPIFIPGQNSGTYFHFCAQIGPTQTAQQLHLIPGNSFLLANSVFAEVRGDMVDLVTGAALTCAQYSASGSAGISVNTTIYWDRPIGPKLFYESANDSFYVTNSTTY